MRGWLERRLVDECPVRHTDTRALGRPVQQRQTHLASGFVVGGRISLDHHKISARRHPQLGAPDLPERKERRPVIARQFEQWQLNAATNS